jgi:hypothetical protein
MLLFEVMTSQEAFETAAQLHPVWVVTLIVAGPPSAVNDWLAGEAEKIQGTGA